MRASRDFEDDDFTGGIIQPFAMIGVIEEFDGQNSMTITSGSDTLTLKDDPTRTLGNAEIGMNFFANSGLSGFARGEFLFGKHETSEAIKIGLRYSFGEARGCTSAASAPTGASAAASSASAAPGEDLHRLLRLQ